MPKYVLTVEEAERVAADAARPPVDLADQAMYQAKRQGGNRISWYDPKSGGIRAGPGVGLRGRSGRYLVPGEGRPNWSLNVGTSGATCFLWGYLLYRGDLDTLWRMLGIVNQLLASTALAVGTTYILLHSPRRRYALCTALPFVFVIVTTYAAAVMSLEGWWAQVTGLEGKIAAGTLTGAALVAGQKQAFLWKLVCVLAVIMLALVSVVVFEAVRRWWSILREPPRAAAG
ncbi:MAG: hypothetical protein HY815_19570 [Candidatus Riflebacteria bacterium]|nr:hypothetical protein [Candidatus Riflebacteria bacterium]